MLRSWFLVCLCVTPTFYALFYDGGAGSSFASWLLVSFFQTRDSVPEERQRDMHLPLGFLLLLTSPLATGSSLLQHSVSLVSHFPLNS